MSDMPAAIPARAWDDFRSRLRSYVRRRVDPAAADDVVGDILLRLVQHREALATARNPTAWLHRVAANAVSDHHRRRAVEHRALSQIGRDLDGSQPPADPEAGAELAGCLAPFIRALPERYGQVLLLTEMQGMNHAAVGRQLGLSVSAVKSRVHRGRTKLRQALVRCCTIELDQHGRVIDVRRRNPGCNGTCA